MLSRVSLAVLPAGFSPVSGANNDFSQESFISRLVWCRENGLQPAAAFLVDKPACEVRPTIEPH
jgi:hypothetical protein